MAYSQGLTSDFVAALNDLHASPEGQWWRDMLIDPKLFVAIRNNYLNVYFRGCSLAKISMDRGNVVADTHYKYLLKPVLRNPYVRAVGGEFQLDDRWPAGLGETFTARLSDLAALKSAAKPYAGEEKKFVGKVIQSHTNVVDVEIALTKDAEEATDAEPGSGSSAKRIDISAVRWEGSKAVLNFYEVKLFGNKEIRSQGDAEVISQVKTYETLLDQYAENIQAGFLRACENVVALNGLPKGRKDLAKKVLGDDAVVRVNPAPILIVGGFDEDQRVGKVWEKHKRKLEDSLKSHRVICFGSAKSVRLAQDGAIIDASVF